MIQLWPRGRVCPQRSASSRTSWGSVLFPGDRVQENHRHRAHWFGSAGLALQENVPAPAWPAAGSCAVLF